MRIIRIVLIFIVINISLLADEVLVLHDNVGAEIDVIEKVHYRLFPEISNFISVQFYLLSNDSIAAVIQSWNSRGPVNYKIHYSQYEFYLMGQEIGEMPPPDKNKIEYLQRKFKPLFAEEHLRNLPVNSYCHIIMNDQREYQGVFQKMTARTIRILDNDKLYDVPIYAINTLKYWDITDNPEILQWVTLIGFAVVGLGGGQLVNLIFNIPANQTGIYLFSGTIIGTVAGYQFIPAVVEKLRPKTVIEFRKSKIKRLDSIGRITYTFKKLKGKIWSTRAERE